MRVQLEKHELALQVVRDLIVVHCVCSWLRSWFALLELD
jgi:hypothetical protein